MAALVQRSGLKITLRPAGRVGPLQHALARALVPWPGRISLDWPGANGRAARKPQNGNTKKRSKERQKEGAPLAGRQTATATENNSSVASEEQLGGGGGGLNNEAALGAGRERAREHDELARATQLILARQFVATLHRGRHSHSALCSLVFILRLRGGNFHDFARRAPLWSRAVAPLGARARLMDGRTRRQTDRQMDCQWLAAFLWPAR